MWRLEPLAPLAAPMAMDPLAVDDNAICAVSLVAFGYDAEAGQLFVERALGVHKDDVMIIDMRERLTERVEGFEHTAVANGDEAKMQMAMFAQSEFTEFMNDLLAVIVQIYMIGIGEGLLGRLKQVTATGCGKGVDLSRIHISEPTRPYQI